MRRTELLDASRNRFFSRFFSQLWIRSPSAAGHFSKLTTKTLSICYRVILFPFNPESGGGSVNGENQDGFSFRRRLG